MRLRDLHQAEYDVLYAEEVRAVGQERHERGQGPLVDAADRVDEPGQDLGLSA